MIAVRLAFGTEQNTEQNMKIISGLEHRQNMFFDSGAEKRTHN